MGQFLKLSPEELHHRGKVPYQAQNVNYQFDKILDP